MPRIVIDHQKCVNSGQCAYLQPDLFEQDETGAPIVLVENPTGDLMAKVQDAIDMCPSQAIRLEEAD